MLPHLERGVLGALLVEGVHDVAVDVDGQALDRPLLILLLFSTVGITAFPLLISRYTLFDEYGTAPKF